jgi:O-antigen/teichoic acid export membrane protein
LIVAALASPREAGIYAAASRFAVAGQIALQAMRLGIAPQISVASARGDSKRVSLLYGVTAQWAVVVCWPIIITIAAFAPLILGVFGPDFRVGATALTIISGGMMVAVAAGNVGTVLLMSGHSSWLARLVWIALIVNIALNLLAVPRWGIQGAAASWTASLFIENVGGAILLHRRLAVRGHGRDFWTTLMATLAASLASAVVSRVALGDNARGFVVHLAVLAVAMTVVVWTRRKSLHVALLAGRREPMTAS